MAAGNTSITKVVALNGSAPDNRRAAGGEALPAVPVVTPAAENVSKAVTPPVIISASTIAITAGDKLLGTIIGPDAKGNLHFVAAQGVFAVDPQSALAGRTDAAFLVTHTNQGIEALLLNDDGEIVQAVTPVKLQLVQANVTLPSEALDVQEVAVSDAPLTLAVKIAETLRTNGQALPQGFANTPKLPMAVQMSPDVASQSIISTTDLDSTAEIEASAAGALARDVSNPVLLSKSQPLAAAVLTPQSLPPGTQVELLSLTVDGTTDTPRLLSVLVDLPDDKLTRAMVFQSPLFGHLIRSGRLVVLASGETLQAPAQIVTAASAVSHLNATVTSARVKVQYSSDEMPSLAPTRLLVLIDTAASKSPLLLPESAFAPTLEWSADDVASLRLLQNWGSDHLLSRDNLSSARLPWPSLKDNLPAEIALLFNAFGRRVISPVASKLIQLRYADNEPRMQDLPMLEALRHLTRDTTPSPTVADTPQRLVLPILVEGQLLPLIFIFSSPEDQHPLSQGDAQDQQSEQDQAFLLAIDFAHLGRLTLRGRCDKHQLSLTVETREALPTALQASAKSLFFETLEANNMTGQLRFVVDADEGWQSPIPAL